MSTEAKNASIVDLNLMSGSKEVFRMTVGGFYDTLSSSAGEVLSAVEYGSGAGFEVFEPDFPPELASDMEETIDSSVIIPNKQVPMRITGDDSLVKSDTDWKARVLGGTFGEKSYDAIYEEAVYDVDAINYLIPYSQMESVTIAGGESFSTPIQITHEYNHYLKEYQDFVSDIDSELNIPNMYFLKSAELALEADANLSLTSSVIKFVSLEQTIPKSVIGNLLKGIPLRQFVVARESGVLPPEDPIAIYLSSSVVLNPVSSSTNIVIQNMLENVMFDEDVLSDEGSPYTLMSDSTDKIPYYMTFTIPTDAPSTTAKSIADNEFSQKFLKTLKEVFLEEISLVPDSKNYVLDMSYVSGSEDSETVYDIESANVTSLRTVDFLKILTYAHNNYNSTTDNCYYVGGKSASRTAVLDNQNVYRYRNSINSMAVLDDVVDNLTTNFETDLKAIYSTDAFADSGETLAYRVEKIGGIPSGDNQTQNVLQNFWFFNSDSIEEINFFDSQVKYDKDYTYKVYAYVLTEGVKYGFSDVRLSRLISESETGINCLEFYDPNTNEPIAQLFESSDDNVLLNNNRFATNAQIRTKKKYVADFNLNYEPNLKILEIPIFQKTLRTMDNPPNSFDVTPSHKIDASNTIEFFINYETFHEELTYPKAISDSDSVLLGHYTHGRDLSANSEIDLESASLQRYIEIYRTDVKPLAYTDFDGKLLKTVDLRIPESKNSYSNARVSDRIPSNKKYYYVFRFVNEQGIPGHLSEIYEAQLVNDGGYVYSVFNILFEEDLAQSAFSNPFTQFKKLIQLQPNVSHMVFDTSDVDFDSAASAQIDNLVVGTADDLIWNKTFKLRTTSRKTGKKIDFNITYKIQSE